MQGYQNFIAQAPACLDAFPGLQLSSLDGVPELSGTITLQDAQGHALDGYQIRIQASTDFPKSFPKVFETGGRIPKNYDWHIYETGGHCCLKTLPEELISCRKGISLSRFIQEEVLPFFFSQTFRRLNGYFLQERAHSTLGWLEFFREVFRTGDDKLIFKGLSILAHGIKPSRSADCFCGSGQKFRKCHRDSLEQLSLLEAGEISEILVRLR
ncbi:SEC-C domain-containing protein [Pedobacter aquatilis]|uniref:SEC-C domain-containing protein n=1 Tax=Pedobacter aquatilis TaxID=351343 RepID=UPI002930F7BD|nr:SEC-C domain-containing protein [Pedobacter aquatilis]